MAAYRSDYRSTRTDISRSKQLFLQNERFSDVLYMFFYIFHVSFYTFALFRRPVVNTLNTALVRYPIDLSKARGIYVPRPIPASADLARGRGIARGISVDTVDMVLMRSLWIPLPIEAD